MVAIIGQKVNQTDIRVYSDDDMQALAKFNVNQLLNMKVSASRKERSYRELCCYKGSCKYIANLNLNKNLNHDRKVDLMTKIRCGFIESVLHDAKLEQVHFLTKSLSYSNCDQPESHAFIASALERHAQLAGVDSVDDYVKLLNEQK